MNCWEFMKCGHEPESVDGTNHSICPAVTNVNFNGCNGGFNAGRACWMIAGTHCKNKRQGSFLDKTADCQKCEFYTFLGSESSDFFFSAKQKQTLTDNSSQVYAPKTITSKMDDEQAILYLLKQLCAKKNLSVVRLTNIYKEIPVENNAEIIEVRGARVLISTNELQLAAINLCGETLIGFKDFPAFIFGRLENYDVLRSIVTFCDLSYAVLYINARSALRVRLQRPLSVIVRADNNMISGSILDISYGGCCINTLTTVGLDLSNRVTLKLKLLDMTTSQIIEADIICEVVRCDNSHRPFKVALSFIHSKQSEEVLSTFINQRQMEIVKELRTAIK